MPFVEEECDRMAYRGSVIYDEYPDQLQMHLMVNRIYEKIKKQKPKDDFEMEMQISGPDENLRNLVQILLFHELFRRRSRSRRSKRFF